MLMPIPRGVVKSDDLMEIYSPMKVTKPKFDRNKSPRKHWEPMCLNNNKKQLIHIIEGINPK